MRDLDARVLAAIRDGQPAERVWISDRIADATMRRVDHAMQRLREAARIETTPRGWIVCGEGSGCPKQMPSRDAILAVLADDEWHAAVDIETAIDRRQTCVATHCRRLVADGLIRRRYGKPRPPFAKQPFEYALTLAPPA